VCDIDDTNPQNGQMRRRHVALMSLLLLPSNSGFTQPAAVNWVRLWFSARGSLDLPSTWSIIDESTRTDMAVAHEANRRYFQSRYAGTRIQVPLAAQRNIDGRPAAWMNLRSYPDQTITQEDVRRRTEAIRSDLVRETEATERQGAQLGVEFRSLGVTSRQIGDRLVFIVEMERRGPNDREPANVRLGRLLDGPDSCTVSVAYWRSTADIWRSVCGSILDSLRVART
jgi:hypothetical protein